jgi:uncharacterized phage protein (TIGR01671 family)
MKKLKFRIWCIDRNEWEKDTCTLSLNGVVLHGNFISVRPESHIVTQYTGSKDEKKRDIYEKDIVKCSGHDDLMVVHYCDDMCMYVLLPVWEDYNSYISDTDNDFENKMLWDNIRIEVVGNIFENPEYVKGDAMNGKNFNKLIEGIIQEFNDDVKNTVSDIKVLLTEWETQIKISQHSLEDLLQLHYKQLIHHRISRFKKLLEMGDDCLIDFKVRELTLCRQPYEEFLESYYAKRIIELRG